MNNPVRRVAYYQRPPDFATGAGCFFAAMNIEEVIKLARLARLKVGAGEVEGLGRDLSAILALVERLESASLGDVEPLAHPLDAVQRLRADEVSEDDRREAFQNIAPHTRDGFYLVPKVLD